MKEMEAEDRLLSEGFGQSVPAAPARTVEAVTLEIRTLQRQAQQILLGYAIEIGRRLEEVKAMLPHGQWGEYLKNEVEYSQSTANNFMRIFREYGAAQQSLFGEAKSQAFANLTYTKALRLLAIPDEEERERFAEEHDVEAMSSRELEQALREREEALEQAEAARKETARLREELAGQAQVYEAKLSDAQAEAQAAKNARKELDARTKRLQEELKALKARPVDVAVEVDEQAAARVRELEKQLVLADPDTAAFRVLFTGWQETFGKMMDVLKDIEAADGEKAGKLRTAVRAAAAGMAE